MAAKLPKLLLLTLLGGLLSCGPKTNTGRNADPSQWPMDPSAQADGQESKELSTRCFQKAASALPPSLQTLCENDIKTNPAFSKLHSVLCADKKLISSLSDTSCGWDGNASTLNRYIHVYEMESDKQKDYEDVHASIVKVPVAIERFMKPLRLAFENYDEFKSQGFQWLSGTREHRNLSGTTWEQGIKYRFRANKDLYDIGYQGTNTLYTLDENTFIHLNYATDDFARIISFSQLVIYQSRPNNTGITIKLEHRKVSSQGLYDRAKKSAMEMTRELMEKGYKNATKP
jgi:hypothetical protein